jgi:glycosyltransferase involved in cell wall biosynthesis
MPDSIEVTVVVPLKNEEESVANLAREVTEGMEAAGVPWECLWVNDGSADRTLAILKELNQKDPRHRWIDLDRNYGQSAAMSVGFRAARGKVIASMDGDGQNDPHDFPHLLERLKQGDADMVNGIRKKRQDSFIRKLSSKIANGYRNWMTRESVTDVGCAIRVFRRECFTDIPVFKGMHRFFPTLVRMQGWRITEIPVNHRPRLQGQTKYGINNRLWVGIADTFAIRWMLWRMVRPKVQTRSE